MGFGEYRFAKGDFHNLLASNALWPFERRIRNNGYAYAMTLANMQVDHALDGINHALRHDPHSPNLLKMHFFQQLRWRDFDGASVTLSKIEDLSEDWPEIEDLKTVLNKIANMN